MTDVVALLWTIVVLLALEGKISCREGAGLRMVAERPRRSLGRARGRRKETEMTHGQLREARAEWSRRHPRLEPCPYSLFRNFFKWHASKPVQPL
jgi:hypothetical protein